MVTLSPKKSIRVAFCVALIGVAVLAGGLTLLAGLSAVNVFHDKSVDEGQKTISNSVLSQLSSGTELLAETLARNLRDPLYLYDFSRIRSILREVSESDSVSYVYLADKDGKLVHDGTKEVEVFGEPIENVLGSDFVDQLAPLVNSADGLVHVNKPVIAGGQVIGRLYIGMTNQDALGKIAYFGDVLANDQRKNQREVFKTLGLIFFVLSAVCLPFLIWVSRKLLMPLYDLVSRSKEYAQGNSDIRFDLQRSDELGELGLALDDMVAKLGETHDEVWRLAYTDVLTGLPNRRQFHERLTEVLELAETHSHKFAMLFLDLDFFKQVNDAYGHDVGDELLKSIARELNVGVANYFARFPELAERQHLLSRISGDEFVLILPLMEIANAKVFAESLYQQFYDPLIISGHTIQQTVSAGITYYPSQGTTAQELMKNADVAMYEAKKNGRATYCEFNEALQSEFQRNSLIKQTVSEAFSEQQFFVEYQPIFDIDSTRIKGAEALVRWLHPELGRLWPASFVSIMDETGLMTKLALWTVKTICEDFKRGCFKGNEFSIGLNITNRTFMDFHFHAEMLTLVKAYDLPRGTLCIEITESNLGANIESWKFRAQKWFDAGVYIWIDDFGGASSSLNLLKELPVDALKISSKLVHDIEVENAQPLIQAIRSFAKALDISVVGVGVESRQQLRLMAEFGCDYAQGFGLATPLAVEKLPMTFDRQFTVVE